MQVSVSDILESLGKSQTIEQEVELSFPEIKLLAPAKVKFKLTNAGNGGIALSGHLQVKAELQCSRCACDYAETLDIPVDEMFLPADSPELNDGAENIDVEAENLCVFSYDNDCLDLSEVMRQNILASLPFCPLCKEDCRGICAGCGVDLNVGTCTCNHENECDPRWEALKKFMPDKP